MGIRSLVLFSFAAAVFSLAPTARGGTGGSTGAGGSAATGNGGAGYDPNCDVSQESLAGATCMECNPTCSGIDSSFHQVCAASASKTVWCNGPNPTQPADQNVACAVALPGGPAGGLAAGGALAVAAALLMRRRRS